jgi:hypothetical protein
MCRDWEEDVWSQPEQPSQRTPAGTQPLQDDLTDDWADFLDASAQAASAAPEQIQREDMEAVDIFNKNIDEDFSNGVSEDIRSGEELELKTPPMPRQRAGVDARAPCGRQTGQRHHGAARAVQRAEPPRQQGTWTTSGDEPTGALASLRHDSWQN